MGFECGLGEGTGKDFTMDTEQHFPRPHHRPQVWHVSSVERAVLISYSHWKGVEAPLMHGFEYGVGEGVGKEVPMEQGQHTPLTTTTHFSMPL